DATRELASVLGQERLGEVCRPAERDERDDADTEERAEPPQHPVMRCTRSRVDAGPPPHDDRGDDERGEQDPAERDEVVAADERRESEAEVVEDHPPPERTPRL